MNIAVSVVLRGRSRLSGPDEFGGVLEEGEGSVVVIGVDVQREGNGLKILAAQFLGGAAAGAGQTAVQHHGQDDEDDQHAQEFNQGKTARGPERFSNVVTAKLHTCQQTTNFAQKYRPNL